jgi:HK97 gp10 family phage protein
MADSVTMEISGLKELADKMRAMGPDIARNALRAGVGEAARALRDEAKQTNPDDTGRTDRALYAKLIKEQSSDHQATYYVGARSGKRERKRDRDAWYWRFVEFGTVKMPARPFLRPAFEKLKMQAVDLIAARIAARIKRFERRGK